jgi:uncharacterized RDD family membrane protein YckC
MKKSIRFLPLFAITLDSLFAMSGVPGPGGSTPEPSTFLLVGIGLLAGGYAVYRGRRRRP